jgi:hypothetical protein
MTWFEYITTHLIPTWFKSFNDNFRMWRDLITGNYDNYGLLKDDDPYQECYEWFWTSINLDETYSKEFLEYLQGLVDEIDRGEVKFIDYSVEDFEQDMKTLEDLENETN